MKLFTIYHSTIVLTNQVSFLGEITARNISQRCVTVRDLWN